MEMIAGRPHLYLSSRSIECLRSYIDGWLAGADASEAEYEMIHGGFQRWIAEHFHAGSAHSWNQIIQFYSGDSYAALNQFFVLYAEFLRLEDSKK